MVASFVAVLLGPLYYSSRKRQKQSFVRKQRELEKEDVGLRRIKKITTMVGRKH